MSIAARKQPEVARRRAAPRDPTVYPVEEKVGEDSLQRLIVELLRPEVERWLAAQGKPSFVGADQFIYYKQHDPSKSVAPDVYVLPGVPTTRRVPCWKVWKTGIVPSLAVEVVSQHKPYKDYVEAPERYRDLGVRELVIFDPDWDRSSERMRWQRYRKLKQRGFVRVEVNNEDRIHSRVLGCWLRVIGEGADARVRLATGPAGDDLFPTALETERAAKDEAVRRVATLEALLAERGGKG